MSSDAYWITWTYHGRREDRWHRASHDGSGQTWCGKAVPAKAKTRHEYDNNEMIGAPLCEECARKARFL